MIIIVCLGIYLSTVPVQYTSEIKRPALSLHLREFRVKGQFLAVISCCKTLKNEATGISQCSSSSIDAFLIDGSGAFGVGPDKCSEEAIECQVCGQGVIEWCLRKV